MRWRKKRAELEAQLAESEALYRSTVDALPQGVVIQDSHGRVLRMNTAAQQLIAGYLEGFVPDHGDHFSESLPPSLDEDGSPLAPEERPAMKALATGEPVIGQVVGIELGNGPRWFRCSANPIDDPGSPDPRVVLTFSEVTEERRISAELADQQRRFRLALEHAPIGMALVGADGRFLEVNAALCDLVGRDRVHLLECTFQEITHPDDIDADVAQVRQLIDGVADSYRMEKRYLTPDGSVVHVLLAVAAVRSEVDGDPYFIAQVVDIGDRKRAEEAQEAALQRERDLVARLTELDRTKTQFVSTVSHELRTPLTSAIGYLELLADGAAGPLSERQGEMVGVAERNSQRLLALIEDLLSLSQIETGQQRSVREAVDVGSLVAGIVETVEPLAMRQGLDLHVAVNPECGSVIGDRAQLERAVLNVVGNAIKFTPSGGQVTIAAVGSDCDANALTRHGQARDSDAAAPTVEIRVSDTGIGIPPEEQDRLFTNFFRSSTAYDNAVPGTGLGLVIASNLVRANGGSIDLESSPETGTVVTIGLPADRRAPGRKRQLAADAGDGGSSD